MGLRRLGLLVLLCCALAACKSSEERAAEHLENGLRLLQEGDPDRALVEFRNTLKLQKDNLTAHRQIGEILIEQNRRRGAYRSFLFVVEKEPEDLRGRIVLSNIAFQTRSWDEFVRHGEKAVEIAPEDPEVQAIDLGLRYRTALLDEDDAARFDILSEAEVLNETLENLILRELRLDAYLARQDYEKALVLVDKNIEDEPHKLEHRTAKVQLLARIGDPFALEAELREIVTLFPEEQEPKRTLLRYLLSQQRVEDAEDFLRELVAASEPEQRNDTYNELIRFILQVRGPEAALTELDAGIADDPSNGMLKALRASIRFENGQAAEAVAEMEQLLSEEPTNLTGVEAQNVKLALARMLLSQGNEVGARKLVEEVLAQDPNAAEALKMQASWLIQEDDTDGAITSLRLALDQSPQDPDALTLMAQAYQRAGQNDLMRNFLSLAVEASNSAPDYTLRFADALLRDGKPEQAETALVAALRLAPRDVLVLNALGEVYLRLDDQPRTRQVIDTLKKIEAPMAQQRANALELELLGRRAGFAEALGFLSDLAEEQGEQGQIAKLALIRARLASGQGDEALSFAQELVVEDPDNLQFRNALALTYAAVRDFPAARTELRGILDQAPDAQSVWLQLSRLEAAAGDETAARAVIDQGLEALPGNPDLLWGKASHLEAAGDIGGAVAIYEELYGRFSSSLIIANNLASLLTTHYDDPESLARADTIARRLRDTQIPAFQDTYGWIQYRKGNYDEALTYLVPAAAAMARDETVIFHLGMTYAALGQRDEAMTQLRRALEVAGPLGADSPLMQEARAKLTELETAPPVQDAGNN